MAEEQIILRPAADLHEQAFTDNKMYIRWNSDKCWP